MTEDEARARFAGARVAVLGTIGPERAPHLVPVVFAMDGERIHLAVDSKPKRSEELARVSNLRRDPRCSLLVHGYDEDWTRLWWARADGRATVTDAAPGLERTFALLRDRYPQYGQGTRAIGPAMVVEILRWSSWSALG